MVCGFTGHRPEKLPWGTNESDPLCQALKLRIFQEVEQAADDGADVFCCGMARGCDLYFAEAVLQLKKARPTLRLEAWLPCPGQADRWAEADRTRWQRLLDACDRVLVVESYYTDGCMLRRDKALVNAADELISVWDGSSGGTGWTVRYAKRQGKMIRALWL